MTKILIAGNANGLAVRYAKDLNALAAILNKLAYSDEHAAARQNGIDPWEADEIDLTALPTFGGDEPADTNGIYSWDARSLLVPDSRRGWSVVPR